MTKIFTLFMCFTAVPDPYCTRFAYAPVYYSLGECKQYRKLVDTDPTATSVRYRCLSLTVPVWQ